MQTKSFGTGGGVLSLETVGRHNAVVFYSAEGSKITLLEDSPIASAQHRLAYREMARLIRVNAALESVRIAGKLLRGYAHHSDVEQAAAVSFDFAVSKLEKLS